MFLQNGFVQAETSRFPFVSGDTTSIPVRRYSLKSRNQPLVFALKQGSPVILRRISTGHSSMCSPEGVPAQEDSRIRSEVLRREEDAVFYCIQGYLKLHSIRWVTPRFFVKRKSGSSL